MKSARLIVVSITAIATLAIEAHRTYASEANGPVISYAVESDGSLFFALRDMNPPECMIHNRFFAKLDNVAGRAWYATVIASWVTGKSISVTGTGECKESSGSESVRNIYN